MTSPHPAAPPGARRRPSGFSRMRSDGSLTALILFLPPAVLLFSLFVIWPIFTAVDLSFYKWNGYGDVTDFVGFKNYAVLLKNSIFHQSLFNSFKLLLASIFLQIPLALVLALLLYRKTSANTAFRLIFFAPYILAEIATGLIWSFIFDGDYGVSAMVADKLGSEPFYILADKQWAFWTIIVVVVWKYFGYHMMIFIAALQAVPTDLIEAAEIDGASPLKTIWYVKLPMILHAIKLSVLFAITGALQVFDIIIPLTNGGPSNSTHSIVSFLYTFGLARMNVGFGAAVGVVLFILCVGTAFSYKRLAIDKGGQL